MNMCIPICNFHNFLRGVWTIRPFLMCQKASCLNLADSLTQLADNGLALVNQASKTKHNLVKQTYIHALSIVAPISCFNSCKQKYQLFSLAPLFFDCPVSLTEGIIFETVLLKDDCELINLKGIMCDRNL